MSKSSSKKVMALSIDPRVHRHVRMFAAANDLTNETVVEWAIKMAAAKFPTYQVPDFALPEMEIEEEDEGSENERASAH